MAFNNLNNDSTKISQPIELNIELMEHQKTAIYAMDKLESDGVKTVVPNNYFDWGIDNDPNAKINIKINTCIGILGDKVGYGKSLEVVGLIVHKLNPGEKDYLYITNPLMSIEVVDTWKKTKMQLVIVPQKIVFQWSEYFELSKLRVIVYDVKIFKENNYELIDNLKNYDIILVGCTKFDDFIKPYNNIKWSRIFIDEADSIKIKKQSVDKLKASFIWLITGTPSGLSHSVRVNSLIKGISPNLLDSIIVKNDLQFLEKSFVLPKPNRISINCLTSSELKIMSEIVPQSIVNMINAGNTDQAIKTLNCNIDTDENILQVVTRNIKTGIDNKKIELEAELLKKYVGRMKDEHEKKIKRIKKIISKLETRFESIKERIYDLNKQYCPVCMGDFTDPVLVSCCKNIFCFDCIVCTLNKNVNKCPHCRKTINKTNLHIIKNHSKENDAENNKNDIKNKMDILLDLIKAKPDGKFLVFANYIETFDKIQKVLTSNKISHTTLKGQAQHIQNTIESYSEGKTQVLMLNAKFFGAGMNLAMTTDIIIYHRFNKEMEEQIIGRAQRIGRKCTLNVYYLLHENEDNKLVNTNSFENFDYEKWLNNNNENDNDVIDGHNDIDDIDESESENGNVELETQTLKNNDMDDINQIIDICDEKIGEKIVIKPKKKSKIVYA